MPLLYIHTFSDMQDFCSTRGIISLGFSPRFSAWSWCNHLAAFKSDKVLAPKLWISESADMKAESHRTEKGEELAGWCGDQSFAARTDSVFPNLEKGLRKPHTPPGSNSFVLHAFKLPCRGATLSPQGQMEAKSLAWTKAPDFLKAQTALGRSCPQNYLTLQERDKEEKLHRTLPEK